MEKSFILIVVKNELYLLSLRFNQPSIMANKKGIHFEVSERKILLRIMDLVMVYLAIYGLNLYTKFEYILFNSENTVAQIMQHICWWYKFVP